VEILTALYFDIMNIDPRRPDWPDRDRFILSKGHATPCLYSVLAKRGYFPEETLTTFDRIDSILQGHPDMRRTPGVDMSSGSLGQGLSVGIGMALGGKANNQTFHTFVLMGCGECQEGQVWEAAMYAGFHRVPRLTAIIDYNRVQLSDTMDNVLSTEPFAEKWKAFNWVVMECDGHDMSEVVRTMSEAKAMPERPVAVIARTVKGKGVSFMENQWAWHGKAANDDEARRAIEEIMRT
jgi:transketolase